MAITEIDELKKNRAYFIEIFSFSNPTNKTPAGGTTIRFPAFLTDFADSFKSNWRSEDVYGRMDPISTFKNTTRNISLSFDVPNDSVETAITNLDRIDFLIKGLYPVYDEGIQGTATLASPPMFRVRFSNLIRNVSENFNGTTLRTGLLSYIEGFDFKPKVDSGFFEKYGRLYPKLISVTLNLKIIHEHTLGKRKNNDSLEYRNDFENFPHGNPKVSATRSKAIANPTTQQKQNTKDEAEAGCGEQTVLGDH